ncbi:hypothetical protein SRHO_G00046180 [Serrasalmus rhombeus]
MEVLTALLLVAGLWRSGVSSRNCPDLIVDSCHCAAERSKELSRHTVRVKVVCEDADLLDTLEPALLPNTTVALSTAFPDLVDCVVLMPPDVFSLSSERRLSRVNTRPDLVQGCYCRKQECE